MYRMVAIFALLLTVLGTAAGNELFPQRIRALDQSFEKLGEYRYVYGLIFELYEAALFTEPGADAEDVLNANKAFHLQFRYLRKIDKDVILKSADRMLERNLSQEQQASIDERVKRINQAYTGVGKGDASSLTYRPGTGTTLMINNKSVITIEGRDFARLYFEIWLGEQAISDSMKQELLGRG